MFFKNLLISIFIFLTPVVPLLVLVGFSILADTIFGVYAARRNGKEVTSRKLARVITKSILYSVSLLLFYGLDVLLINKFVLTYFPFEILLTKLTAFSLVLLELFSIDETIKSFNNNKGFWWFISQVIIKLKYVKKNILDLKTGLREKEDI